MEKKNYFLNVCLCLAFQESAKSISEKYGSLNLLINASGILSIPQVLQPGMHIGSLLEQRL